MIEIRIRHEWDVTAVHLADVCNVEEIDAVLRSLKGWGILDVVDPADSVFGQWVVNDDAAYFEFVLTEADG